MTNGPAFDRTAVYKIRVIGMLDQTWSDWFDGITINRQGDETIMVGPVEDQAALLGILTKISDLGLTLLLVKRGKNIN